MVSGKNVQTCSGVYWDSTQLSAQLGISLLVKIINWF